ncbi:MAG: hypothetical protein KGJ02_04050 [Verrucomicrobiota bacterium]|nr:hypothetical protein [Verrucomicrobiota bacterium]
MVGNILPVAEGIEYGLTLTEPKRLEDSVRAGRNAYFTAFLQVIQTHKAMDYTGRAMAAAGQGTITAPFYWAACLISPLLAIWIKKGIANPTLRSCAVFAQNHLSILCHVAALVSTIALFYFGQPFFAVASLCILGIGFLDRNGLLPERVRQIIHTYGYPLMIITGLVCGNIFDKCISTLSIVCYCAQLYFKWKERKEVAIKMPEGRLRSTELRWILNGMTPLRMNRNYVHYQSPMSQVPNIDISTISQEFEATNWALHMSAFRCKAKNDVRFREIHGYSAETSDEKLIEMAKEDLSALITSVKERRILQGEPKNYRQLEDYLKVIADHLRQEQDPVLKADMLLRLAIEGGEYCGPGKFEVVESIYNSIISDKPELPLSAKILHCLQLDREATFERIYAKDMDLHTKKKILIGFMGKVVDWQDIHNYNLFINLYGPQMGVKKAGAANDEMAFVDPLMKVLIANTVGKERAQEFWRIHTKERQAGVLEEAIGTPRLPKDAVYAWWQQWIERQPLEEATKESLQQELSTDASLYGRKLETPDRKFQQRFIYAMLVDLGILETP